MTQLYPLLMSPFFSPRPWGSQNLAPIYPGRAFEEKIGEAWLTGDDCKPTNGPLRGFSLNDLSSQYGTDFVGTAAPDPKRFPLLTKFLFPHEKLSVQVHPDDDAARRAGHPNGKTECWYVAHAQPGAQLALGLKPGVSRQQLEAAISQQTAEGLLNWIKIFPGDILYVAAGTVHTLGPGSVIVETQQQSDLTYRLYDYGRPRELHLKDGMAAVKEKVGSGKVVRPAPREIPGTRNRLAPLVMSSYFAVESYELKDPQSFSTAASSGKTSAQILIAVEGCGVIEALGCDPVTMAKGDAVVVPAVINDFQIRPQWSVELIKSSVPGEALPDPVTRL